MTPNNVYETYKNNAIMTASREELTLMLYDGALKFCNQAMKAIDENKTSEANNCIIKIENIIKEFQSTLNKRYEVSKSLDLLYDYMYRRLIEANIKKDKQILLEVYNFIKELRDTWKEAIKLSKEKKVVNG